LFARFRPYLMAGIALAGPVGDGDTGGHAGRSATRSTVLVVTVGDPATGAFIADAQVRLPSVGRVVRTKWNGEAHFADLAPGRYRVQVRALGYAPGDIDMPVSGDTAAVHFELQRLSASLDTVRITAEAPARGLKEFEARRQMGIGRFLSDSALADDRTRSLQYLLATRFPGIFVSGRSVVSAQDARGCDVLIYLDGFKMVENDLDVIRPADLSGIEVYSRISAPVQYRPLADPKRDYCKVVLLWTRW
jgi:hypothetical protein